ncbi:sensor histidine kinase [Micromonospora globbae]|uniref:histidine kinase n=1 Tax=Micromonospora globbae TaxID=1894969 RepID=A0A420F8S1_9ACTN|nr:sensor histidine kinase [Micromonospora globbae]RKF29324.1 histidine kinase [Micromonospora globbae]
MSPHADAWSAVRGRPWRFLVSAWPWRSLAYLASTVPIGIGVLLVLATVVGLGLLTAVIVVGLLLLAGVPLVATVIAEIERARLRLVLPQPSGGEHPTLRERLRTWRTVPVSWSEIGYATLLATVGWVVDAVVLTLAVTTPVVLILAPALVRYDAVDIFGWRIDTVAEAWPAVAVGVLVLAVVAYLLTALASAQAALTRLLLDPPEARLVAAVTELRRSRVGLVDAFEAERRRIERDLHDGAQQRLVALTMTLGQAELELDDGPALDLVTRAHALAEEALEDLRATVRGIHPQVLTDHGLAAAIHELADRSPVPVDTDLHLAGRLPARVETAAYFLVSEALTNVARHSGARDAQVHAWMADGTLTVTVVDDGRGGADPARGSGLAGLAARIDAIDGTLDITSPPGGPTHVRMTCPIGPT